jgi:excisionase family DNA binding protein
MTLDGYLTIQMAADELGVTAHTIRVQIGKGRIRIEQVGASRLISTAEITRYRSESLGQPGRKVNDVLR